jgi:hypothetical protein
MATLRRTPQALVKVTGGGRGMKAIAAHFRYICKNGPLEIEDDRGATQYGKEALQDLERHWRFGSSLIDERGDRREAFNTVLSMPRGTDPIDRATRRARVREDRPDGHVGPSRSSDRRIRSRGIGQAAC